MYAIGSDVLREGRADTPRAHTAELVCARFVAGRDELLTLGAEQCVRRWSPAPSQTICNPSLQMALPALTPTAGAASRVQQVFAVRSSSHRSDVLRYCVQPRLAAASQNHASALNGPNRRSPLSAATLLFVPSHNDVLVYDAECGVRLAALKAHVSDVRQCVWRERAQELLSLGADRQLLLWTPCADRPVLDAGAAVTSSSDASTSAFSLCSYSSPSASTAKPGSALSASPLGRSRNEETRSRSILRVKGAKISRTATGARVDPFADTWSDSDASDS